MGKVSRYEQNMQEHLRQIPIDGMSLYSRGIGGSILPRAGEKFEFYLPDKFIVVEVTPPDKSERLDEIIEARAPKDKVVNNFLPGIAPPCHNRHITLPLFRMDYRHWRGTLPQGDEFDADLTKGELYTPFSTASVVVSNDGYFIAPQRTKGRASHGGDRCMINGCGPDRDDSEATEQAFNDKISEGTGVGLARQNERCVAGQLNIPRKSIQSTKINGLVSSEPSFADVGGADYAMHASYVTRVDMTASEVVDAANELYGDVGSDDKGRYVRLNVAEHAHPFEPDYLSNFCNENIESIAMTMQPILWLAGATVFGEEWVKRLTHVDRR